MKKVVNSGNVTIESQKIYFLDSSEKKIYDNLEFRVEFKKYIDNLGINLAHSSKEEIEFDDLYTPPDLKLIEEKETAKKTKFKNLSEVIIEDIDDYNFVLLGDDISGKTSSAKYLLKWFYFKGFIPIFINGRDIKDNIRLEIVIKKIGKQFNKQFSSDFQFEEILKKDSDKFIIIIDDFHQVSNAKSSWWYHLIKNLKLKFKNLILTGKSYMPMETVIAQSKKPVNIFEEFDVYWLMEFGPKLRYAIANKWNRLGCKFPDLEKDAILEKNDLAVQRIEQIIGKGYVPSFPLYILTLLQTFESQSVINRPQYSIHGFYYELLINTALSKAIKNSDEIGVYNNLLSYIAFYFFKHRKIEIEKSEMKQILTDFSNELDIEVYDDVEILATLSEAKLLNVESTIFFYPQYIYYFYVAKYLSDKLNSDDENVSSEIREIITKLAKRLYRDEFSSIIIFLTHLSKDKFIIDELLNNSKEIFKKYSISKLEDDIHKLNDLIKELPEQVLELMSVEEAREEHNNFLEEHSQSVETISEEEEDEAMFDYNEDLTNINLFEQITLSLKTIDILGQIAKKYWGELSGDVKYKIASETYYVGLRTLSMMLSSMMADKEGIKELVRDLVEKQLINDRKTKSEFEIKELIEENANRFLFNLSFLTAYGIIKRVSGAIGSKNIGLTLDKIVEEHPVNSVKLIDMSIKLDYRFDFPWGNLENEKYIKPNMLSHLIKQNLIMHYLYLYESNSSKKMRIASKFGIELKRQIKIDKTSRIKRKSKKRI